jgi:hypothetical protein
MFWTSTGRCEPTRKLFCHGCKKRLQWVGLATKHLTRCAEQEKLKNDSIRYVSAVVVSASGHVLFPLPNSFLSISFLFKGAGYRLAQGSAEVGAGNPRRAAPHTLAFYLLVASLEVSPSSFPCGVREMCSKREPSIFPKLVARFPEISSFNSFVKSTRCAERHRPSRGRPTQRISDLWQTLILVPSLVLPSLAYFDW